MGSVNTGQIKNYGNELNDISNNLKEILFNMKNDLNIINEAITTLESYNGKDSSGMYLIPPTREIGLGTKNTSSILQTCYKNIWTIKVTKTGL